MTRTVDIETLAPETREWMQVMASLRVGGRDVCYEDLCYVGLSGMVEALRELEDADLVRVWGGARVVYYEMLWL